MKRAVLLSLWLLSGIASAQDAWMPDVGLQQAVRDQLNLPSNAQFTKTQMLRLQYIDTWNENITDLTGIEHAKNITWISFAQNDVSDLSPLSEIPRLGRLIGWAVYNRSGRDRQIQLPEKVSRVASGVENKQLHTLGDLNGESYLKFESEMTGGVPEANPADLNSDGRVNVLDLVIVANAFGKDTPDVPDVNGDGFIRLNL